MTRTAAIYLTVALAISVSAFVLRSPEPTRIISSSTDELRVNESDANEYMSEASEHETGETLPDYRPFKTSEVDERESPEMAKPPSLEETVSDVESSISKRIEEFNRNLGDRSVRVALQRELSSQEMEAYKAAILWKVKQETAVK